jgi:hypothetical protein
MTTGANTTRRTRSRGTTPLLVPDPSAPTPTPVLATISEGDPQPNEAGASSANATRQSHPNPPTRPYNTLDSPIPSFSSPQRQDRQDGTASGAPQLQQTTGPLLESSQPPPAFSQLGISFGSVPLGTSFTAAAIDTSLNGPAFTTPHGKGNKHPTTPLSLISTLSSPTSSGNFRYASTMVPNPRILPSNTTTTAPNSNNTTLLSILTAPRGSRASISFEDKSDIEELSSGEDSHVNELYGNRKRHLCDRPGLASVDKAKESYQGVHVGGGSNASASGSRGRSLRLPEPLKMLDLEGESQGFGAPGDGSGSGTRPGGTGATTRRGVIPRKGGQSRKLTMISSAKWVGGEGFNDTGSTGTDWSAVPAKGKAPVSRPFSNPFIRILETKDAQMSEDEISRASSDSFIVIPDSQEPPSLLSQPPAHPRDPAESTKSTDSRRRLQPPVLENQIHAHSQAGPHRSQTKHPSKMPVSPSLSPSTKDRMVWQLSSAKPYIGGAELSKIPVTPTESSSAKSGHSLAIQCKGHLEKPVENFQEPSPRKPMVLVSGTPSTSQESNFVWHEPSVWTTHPSLAAGKYGVNIDKGVLASIKAQNRVEPFVELPGLVQEDSFGVGGIGGQTEYLAETKNVHIEERTPAAPINLFELLDPDPTIVQKQQASSGKRKRDVEAAEPVQGLANQPSPSKKDRKAPMPPAPVPAETLKPIRHTRSSTASSSKPSTSRGPLTTPVPPPRLVDAGRSRKRTTVPRTSPPQPRRNTTLDSIIESSSPTPPPPSSTSISEATFIPDRRSKAHLQGKLLVPNSSASTVGGGEVLGTSAKQAETFKTLAQSVDKSKPGKRNPSAVSFVPYFLLH